MNREQGRPSAAEIRRWIFQGHYDNDIDSISTSACDRQQSVKLAAVSHLRTGDHARVGNTLNPKYLRGMEVVIHQVNGDKALVTFVDRHRARRYGYGDVSVPLRSLIPVH